MRKLIFFLSIALFIGCNDFLDEKPISNISLVSFYKTSEQFEQVVNGAYKTLHQVYIGEGGRGSVTSVTELRSDNSTYMFNPVHQGWYELWNLDRFIAVSSNQAVRWTWNRTYEGIGACNIMLHFSGDKDFENKDQYEAEVKFLRALYYFHLVKNFGDVPLVLTKVETLEEAFSLNKRTPQNLIYEQIISDLNFAKQNLPKKYTGKDVGRVTEGAARTLLAKVLMWQDKYSEAIDELEIVQKSGVYSLLDDYADVFNINNKNNEEIIFAVQFLEGPYGLSSNFMYVFLPYNIGRDKLPFQNGETSGINIPTEDLINSFEKNDIRLSMIDTTFIYEDYPDRGVYKGSIVPFTLKYNDKTHSQRFNTGANFNHFRYPHVLLMLAECYHRVGGGDPVLLVNQVRKRAGLTPLTSVTLDDIIHERRVEFHCEIDRWDVLVRTGKVKEVMRAHGEREKKRRPDFSKDSFTEIKILLPIPSTVIEKDPTMEQNDEYK